MKRRYSFILTLLFSFVGLSAMAQQEVRVITSLTPTGSILIGEQTHLQVKVVYPKSETPHLVLPKDTLVGGVEILSTQVADSSAVNDKLRQMIYKVAITSFDSATYTLSNVGVMVGDSLYKPLASPNLIVNTVKVDMAHPDQFKDIKAQWKPPFVWKDYLVYFYAIIAVVLLLVIIGVLIYLYMRKQSQATLKPVVVERDPYEEAIEAMNELKSQGLDKKNMAKEYYTALTDILRRYIYRVYGIQTADKTSSEILSAFKAHVNKGTMYSELTKILGTADLAKFAKYAPSEDENISLLNASFSFVEEGKPAPEIPQESDEPKAESTK